MRGAVVCPPAARRALFCFYIYWDAVSPATVPLSGQFLPRGGGAGAVRGRGCSAAVACAACASSPSRMDGSCATICPSVRPNLNTRYRDAASPAAVPYPASSSRAGAGWSCTGAGLLCGVAVACASLPSRMDCSRATIRPSVRRNLNTTRRGGRLRGLRFVAFEDGRQLRHHLPVGQAELEHQIPGRSFSRRSPLPGQIVPRGGGAGAARGRGCSAARRWAARPARSAPRRLRGWTVIAPPSARRSGGT